jgi:hypothetical protein
MSTLTRARAEALIDEAEEMGALDQLAAHWDIPGHWNAGAEWDAGAFRDFVDEHCVDGDRIRANGPSDDDETDLTDCELI